MELDTRNTIYANGKHSAENFLVVQVGLCPFQWVAEAGHFKVAPFKFQIFPRLKPSWGYSVAPSFMCESASMKFLSLNQIDVTDAIDNGVPYLSDAQERTYREALMSRRLPQPIPFQDFDYHELSAADTVSIELNIQRVMQWHELITDSLKKGEDRSLTLRLQLMPILHRRVLVEAIRRLYPMLVPITLNEAGTTLELGAGTEVKGLYHLEFTYTGSSQQKAALEARVRAEILAKAEEDLSQAVGFKRIVDELAKGPAVLVGHKCLLDLMHIQEKFGPGLPPDLSNFSSALHAKFPVIFDTKHIVHSDGTAAAWGGQTDLHQAFKRTNKENVPVVKAEGFESLCDLPTKAQLSGNTHHEAGLDAFAAGLLFARLARGRGIHPVQLRSLPQLVKKTQHAEAPEEDGHDRNILRQVLRRTEEKAAEESGERPEVDTMEARRGDGAEKAGSPLQKFADTANWLYAGIIRNVRGSFGVSERGRLRACQAEDDDKARSRWGQKRPDVLLLWDFPEDLTDTQLREAVVLQQEERSGSPAKRHNVVRIDRQSALVMFPTQPLARAFWEGSLLWKGRLDGGPGEVALEVEEGKEVRAKVETFETFVALCESGVTAPDVTQAARWLGLDPKRSFRKGYPAVLLEKTGDSENRRPFRSWKREEGGRGRGEQVEAQSKPVYGVVGSAAVPLRKTEEDENGRPNQFGREGEREEEGGEAQSTPSYGVDGDAVTPLRKKEESENRRRVQISRKAEGEKVEGQRVKAQSKRSYGGRGRIF